MSLIDDINNPLEQLKVEQAFHIERMKLEYRKITMPDQINILDYTVIAALEKQMQKKPIKHQPTYNYTSCPVCNTDLIHAKNYCTFCGQAIDWRVEE